MKDFREIMELSAKESGIMLDSFQLDKFDCYYRELKFWEGKINLTAIHNAEDIAVKHFIDSLSTHNLFNGNESLLDIGSGGGFPSIPLKIYYPKLKITSIDSSSKKIHFQKHISRLLELDNMNIISGRVESFPESENEKYDAVVCRAFSDLSVFIRLAERFPKNSGLLIAMKSETGEKEISACECILEQFSLEVIDKIKIDLPFNKGKRQIIVFKKHIQA